ncbi:glycosyltransferase [Microbacterium sp. NPDC091313]
MAAVPASHPYSRAITDPAAVRLLADPQPPGAEPGRWWPPQVLTAPWLERNLADVDVVHAHFGLESLPPGALEESLAVLRRSARPLVFTVHDLENPQLTDQSPHRRALDAIIPAADALITLTAGAADAVRERWGRECTVIAHPTLVPDDEVLPAGDAAGEMRVGVHVRDLRPNIDAVGTAATLVRTVAHLRAEGARVRGVIRMNDRVRDEALARAVADVVAGHGDVTLERGPRQDDDQLMAWLAGLDVCLLPYAHGTHSGWAEMCHDLAVPVAGTRAGYVREQHPADFEPFAIGDPSSLVSAVLVASEPGWSRPGSPARRDEVARRRRARRAELSRVRDAHVAVYRQVIALRGAR